MPVSGHAELAVLARSLGQLFGPSGELGTLTLNRKEGIVNFYREMFKTVRENLTLHHLVADADGLAADVTSQFTAITDAPDFVVAPLKRGEFVRVRVLVYYTLRDGKIAHIRVARSGAVSAPAKVAGD